MSTLWSDLVTYADPLMEGLWVSLQLTFMTLGLGLPGGLVLAIAAASRSRAIGMVATTLVELGRGTPVLVLLLLVYNGIPLTLPAFVAAFIALAISTAAYSSEIIRGGLQAVPEDEVEAGQALGMSRAHVLRDVIVPQGLRIAMPPLVGFCIIMFQATSLAYVIAVRELTAQAKSIANETFHYFNLFLLAGALYAALSISASVLNQRAEKRLNRHA
ncbi:amino acid ABC transporter permease [Nocardioides astragali]|uniref:Amino acid ABC transporter permease n=1 Tax=Nocardioides astragali TaxID=1776736 RepID=A0ABW2N8D5_9ACTN|nr:amino acid ABC transporter permease [Nocardioides astragali]